MGGAEIIKFNSEKREYTAPPIHNSNELSGETLQLQSNLKQQDLTLLRSSVREFLDNHVTFNRRQFPIESPRIARIIDEGYREQLVVEAELFVEREFLDLLKADYPYQLASEVAQSKAIEFALDARPKLAEVWRRSENVPVISFMGTANSNLVDPDLKDADGSQGKRILYYFVEKLGQEATLAGVSGLNGGSSTGIMGAQTNSWNAGLEKVRAIGRETDSKIIAVPLKFHKDHREPPTENASNGYVTPAISTFLGRTPALLAFGRQYSKEDPRQRVMVINVGGLGTLEEVGRVLSEIKLQGQVTGVFSGSNVKPPLVVLVSPEIIEGKSFWKGQIKFFEMMRNTKAWRGSMDENLIIVEPKNEQEVDGLVRNIVGHYQRVAESKFENAPPTELAGLNDVEMGVLKGLDKILHSDREFTARYFDGSYPSYLRILDAQFDEEVKIQAERYVLSRIEQLKAAGEDNSDAIITSLDDARKIAISWRGQLKELVDLCRGTKTITIIGSGNNGVWNDKLDKATDRLMQTAVKNGYTVVVGGDGREGVSEKVCSAWLIEKAEFDLTHPEGPSTSKLVRIQLDINGRTTQPMDFEGNVEILGPAVQTIITKSGLVTALGEENSLVIYPHGIAELEAVEGAVLAAQLAGSVDTPFRSKGKSPGLFFLNADLGYGKFFAAKQDQYDMIAETGAAGSDFLSTINFLDLDNPDEVAKTICKQFEDEMNDNVSTQ